MSYAFIVRRGSSSGNFIDIQQYTSLPEIVTENRILVSTTTSINEVVGSDTRPASASTGDIWINTKESANIIQVGNDDQAVSLYITDIWQYIDSSWTRLVAYAGIDNTWVQVSSALIRYGFRRTKAESDPDARIVYLYDAVGMTPASYSDTTFSYGSWQDFMEDIARPVMLNLDGTVDYELDHNNQLLKLDGTASDIQNSSYTGNAMVEFNDKFKWVCRAQDSDYEYIIFSNAQVDDTYTCYAYTVSGGIEGSAFYWAMFCSQQSNLSSLGNLTLSTSVTSAYSSATLSATSNGENYNIAYKSGWDYICDLLTMFIKSDDLTIYGTPSEGYVSGTTIYLNTGAFSNSDAYGIKVLWIQILKYDEYITGLFLTPTTSTTGGFYVRMYPPYSTDNSVGAYFHAPYTLTGYGYISGTVNGNDTGYLPISNTGSNSTYMCSYVYVAGSARFVCCTYRNFAGLRNMRFSLIYTATQTYTASRLTYIKA